MQVLERMRRCWDAATGADGNRNRCGMRQPEWIRGPQRRCRVVLGGSGLSLGLQIRSPPRVQRTPMFRPQFLSLEVGVGRNFARHFQNPFGVVCMDIERAPTAHPPREIVLKPPSSLTLFLETVSCVCNLTGMLNFFLDMDCSEAEKIRGCFQTSDHRDFSGPFFVFGW